MRGFSELLRISR